MLVPSDGAAPRTVTLSAPAAAVAVTSTSSAGSAPDGIVTMRGAPGAGIVQAFFGPHASPLFGSGVGVDGVDAVSVIGQGTAVSGGCRIMVAHAAASSGVGSRLELLPCPGAAVNGAADRAVEFSADAGSVLSLTAPSSQRWAGRVVSLLPLVAAVPKGSAASSAIRVRACAVTSDGLVLLTSTSSKRGTSPLSWARDESLSAVASVLSVEPVLSERDRLGVDSLSLASRLQGQAQAATAFVQGLVGAISALASKPEAIANPAAAREIIGRVFPGLTGRNGGSAFDRVMVFVSRQLGPGQSAVLSASSALPAERASRTSAVAGVGSVASTRRAQPTLWRLELPLRRGGGSRARAAVAPWPAALDCSTAITSTAVSREARSPAGDPAILVVEGCASDGLAATRASLVDAWNGAVLSSVVHAGLAVTHITSTGLHTASGNAVQLGVDARALARLGAGSDAGAASLTGVLLVGAPTSAQERSDAVAKVLEQETVVILPISTAPLPFATSGVGGFRVDTAATDAANGDVRVALSTAWQTASADSDRVLAWSAPTPQEWQDGQASELQMGKTLADGSVLLEHRSQLVTVITGAPPAMETGYKSRNVSATVGATSDALAVSSSSASTSLADGITVRLLSAITGRSVHLSTHAFARGPVRLAWLSDTLVYSYWNTMAQRTEVSVIALYGARIDPFDLNPLSTAATNVPAALSAHSPTKPLVLHRTYALPLHATALSTTVTRHGFAPHPLLIGTTSGTVYSLDRRFFDPRRPTGEPSDNDKAEGLATYDPLLPMPPALSITHHRELPRLSSIVAAPTHMESASIVVATGLDIVVTRVLPSGSFDALDPDFSFLTVVGLLVAGFAGVQLAIMAAKDKRISQAWM